MTTSYELANVKRDLSDVLSTIIKGQPRFISLFTTTAPATSTTHEWLEDQIAPMTVTISSISESTATVSAADAAKIAEGSILRVKDDPALFEVSAVSGTNITLTLVAANGSAKSMPATSDVMYIAYTPREEGSCDGKKSFHQSGTAQNYTQIFRGDIEITGTSQEVKVYGLENRINYQTNIEMQKLARDMNNAAIFGIPRAHTASTTGMAGGLFHFGSQAGGLSINANGNMFDSFLVNDGAQQITDEGAQPSIILCSPGQARVLSADMVDQVIINQDNNARGSYVARVTNDITGAQQTIFSEPMMPDNIAFVLDPTGLGLTPLGGRSMADSDATTATCDSIRRKIIGEYTFEFKNSLQRISKIYGLMGSMEALAAKRTKTRNVKITNTTSDPVNTKEVAG